MSDETTELPQPPPRKRKWWPRLLLYGGIVLCLVAMAIPNFVKARTTACRNSCINNLRQIDGAKEQWMLEKKASPTTPVVEAEIALYIKGGWPLCPSGGKYILKHAGDVPKCSVGHTLQGGGPP